MTSPLIAMAKESRPPLMVWELPNRDCDYVQGIDAGEGLGQEESVSSMFCRQTGAQVAEYVTNQQDPEEFADSCMALGNLYNEALSVIERNSIGLTVVVCFKQNYRRGRIWKQKVFTKAKHIDRIEYGWQTSRTTRSHLIFDFKSGIKRGHIKVRSQQLLNQMKTFVRKKEGRTEHADGEFDDRIFAAALAYQGFKDVIPRAAEPIKRELGPTTVGEFVAFARGLDSDKKKRDFRIGVDADNDELGIILRR